MERIEEFKQGNKSFIYFDLSGLQDNVEIEALVFSAKERIAKYPSQSLYTITNVSDIVFDTRTKEIAAQWMEFNRPYVVNGAVIGLDGVRKIMYNAVLKLTSRTNMKVFTTRQQAIDWMCTL